MRLLEVHLPLMKREKVAGMSVIQIENGVMMRWCRAGDNETIFLAHGGSALEPNSGGLYREVAKMEDRLLKIGVVFGGDAVFQGSGKIVEELGQTGQSVVTIDAVRKLSKPGVRTTDYAESIEMSWSYLEKNGGRIETAIGDSLGALATVEATINRIENGKPVPDRLILINTPIGGFDKTTLECAKAVRGGSGMVDLYPGSEYLIRLRSRLKATRKVFPETIAIYGDVGPDHVGFALGGVPITRASRWGEFTTGGDGVVNTDGAKMMEGGILLVDNLAHVRMCGCFHNLTRKQAAPIIGEIMKNGTVAGTRVGPGVLIDVPDCGWLSTYEDNCTIVFGALQAIIRRVNK